MIVITDELERKLTRVAEQKNQSVMEILENFAAQELRGEDVFRDNPLLILARMADEAGIRFRESDTALRSRELLDRHFADDLLRRIQDDE